MRLKEAVTGSGVRSAELAEILGIIKSTAARFAGQPNAVQAFEDAVNPLLEPYRVQFCRGHKLLQQGAPACFYEGWVGINTPPMGELVRPSSFFRVMLSHELTHRDQSDRADASSPGGGERMASSSFRRMFPGDKFDFQAYEKDKQELMAYARSLVDMMLERNLSPAQIRGALRRASQSGFGNRLKGAPGSPERRRFMKYAAAYADKEDESRVPD
jgi:hypothetical protein